MQELDEGRRGPPNVRATNYRRVLAQCCGRPAPMSIISTHVTSSRCFGQMRSTPTTGILSLRSTQMPALQATGLPSRLNASR